MATLSPERWAEVERLFDELADLPEGDRTRALTRLHDADHELAGLLSRMLASDGSAGRRIAGAIGAAAAGASAPVEWIGRRFGPYEAVREIGRGGMGIVFEAIRADDEYRKRVALKIAPAWRAVPGLVERFRSERQILAELETETIARFLDGGTEDGVPYFVMEFVDGEPITAFCRRHGLSLRERLRLFQQVCTGVSFAHEHLVVHRDLKPANILVTTQGTPKLVDFGVAKLLNDAADTSATATSFPAWTPDYVSPEQLRGRPVSARTDIYALGLILYELLCGERGQQGDTSSLLALDRSVCEREPLVPSEQARRRGERGLARDLEGDLDTIVLKAIRKDPDDRYASVAAFSDDLQRFLDDRPIQARDIGGAERAVKFVRRHRTAASFLAVLAGTAAAGVISTIRQAKRAERRFQQVRSLANTFVFDVHDSIADLPGATAARQRIVSTALTYLESLRDDAGDDPALALELASAYEKVGSVQGLPLKNNLGDTGGALESYANALRMLRPLMARGDLGAERLALRVLHRDALVRRARGDRHESNAAFELAWQASERALARMPDDADVLDTAASIASDTSRTAFELRDLTRSERFALLAMELSTRLAELCPDRPAYADSVAGALNSLGAVELGLGKLEDAAGRFRESVRLRAALVDAEPDSVERRRSLSVSYGYLADVLALRMGENLGDERGAEAALRGAADLAEWARQRDVRDRRPLYDLANVRVRLGTLYSEWTPPRLPEAIAELRAARAHADELVSQDPTVVPYRFLQLAVARRLGDALDLAGNVADAAACLEEAIALGGTLLDSANGPGARTIVGQATARLARLRVRQGDVAAGTAHARRVAGELAQRPLSAVLVDAAVHLLVGEAFADACQRESEADPRLTLMDEATRHLDAAELAWKGAALPAALEAKRGAALEAIALARRPWGSAAT